MRGMALQAKTLCAAGASAHLIRDLVRDQRVVIDAKLSSAPKKWGRNVIAHDLPMTFSIPGLERKDAQRLVYSALVLDLDERGFSTMICPTDTHATLYIAFEVNFGVGEVSAMDALLAARTLPPARVADWIAGRGGPDRKIVRPDPTAPDRMAGPDRMAAEPPDLPLGASAANLRAARIAESVGRSGDGLRAPHAGVTPPRYVYHDNRIATPREGLVRRSAAHRQRGRASESGSESDSASVADSVSAADTASVAGSTALPPPGPGWPSRSGRSSKKHSRSNHD
jgi:hypothetical protein